MTPLLSILVPTVPSRREGFLPAILAELERQAEGLPVEILCLYDNKRRSVGEKRNALMDLARGSFVAYVDDDDRVDGQYVNCILKALRENPEADCVVFDCICTVDNGRKQHCRYGIELPKSRSKAVHWTGKPSHTMVWRRDLIKHLRFPDQTFGEDSAWVDLAWPLVKNQVRIDRVLYFYDFNRTTSETRKTALAPGVPRTVKPPSRPLVSVVMATRNKPKLLRYTLESIFKQKPSFEFEVIVVDDGSDTNETSEVCLGFRSAGHRLRYYFLDNDRYRNPGLARNYGYRKAAGRIVIAQSDDVVHASTATIERLAKIEPGTFNIATVYNALYNPPRRVVKRGLYTGVGYQRPLFFLGSLLREHIYAIGGNSEDFQEPGYEDDWFGMCLIHGLGLKPVYRTDVEGLHQDHPRLPNLLDIYKTTKRIFEEKLEKASRGEIPWAGGEPWNWEPNDEDQTVTKTSESDPVSSVARRDASGEATEPRAL